MWLVAVRFVAGIGALVWLCFQLVPRTDATVAAEPSQAMLPARDVLAAVGVLAASLVTLGYTALALHRRRNAIARAADAQRNHLAAAMGAAPLGTWEWHIADGHVEWSDTVWRMFGLEPGSRPLNFELFRDALHPDDRARVLETLERALADGSPYHLEARVVRPDGTVRWMLTHGHVLKDEGGRPLRMAGVDLDITAQKALDAERRASEELFATAFERSAVGIGLVAPDGRWIKVNDALCQLLGYSKHALEASDFQSLTHPDDLDESLRLMRQLHAGEIDLVQQEKRYRHAAGHFLWVYVTVGLVRDAAGVPRCHVTQVQDIDARKRGEAELAAARQAAAAGEREREELLARLNEAQRAAGIGSWNWDVATGRVWWSDELYRIFELDPASYVPSVAGNAQFVHDEDRAAYHELVERTLAAGAEFEYDLRIVTGRGRERYCRSRGYVERAADGKLRRVFGTFQDRTDARLLEDQLRQAHKLESLGSLAGGIAHDFNNLLAAILGNAALARARAGDPPAVIEKISRIEEAGHRAKGLVDQILSFSRRQPTQLASTDIGALVSEVAALLRATIPAGIALAVDVEEHAPHALVDPSQLHQVLLNLGTNAWHAVRDRTAADSRIAFAVRGEELDAQGAREVDARFGPGRYCVIEVRDNGVGMDAATRARIFEPFFTTRLPGSGTGLGLAVVHNLVTALRGAIAVESTPGIGSCFTLYLPEAPEVGGAEPASPRETAVRSAGSRHVLYVDDEPALTAFVCELLELDGFEVTACASADEALGRLREPGACFDVVVTDYNMPGRSGLELAREVAVRHPGLPVILGSGYFTPSLQQEAEALGVRAFLNKADIVTALPRLLKNLFAPSLQA